MLRAFAAFCLIVIVTSACTQRSVCPAFQSAYIYDKDQLRKRFSYLKEDSTPKIYTASKTRYLIAEPVSYRKKIRMMETVPMRPVYVALPDSFKIQEGKGLLGEEGEDGVVPGAELDLAARSVIDSIYIEDVPRQPAASAEDSVYVISKDRETRVLKYNFPDSLKYDENTGRYVAETPKYAVVHVTFNVDQDNYMWYLRDYLVLPDVRQSRILQQARNEDEKNAKSGKKKKEGGFFKNLFKKKKKEQPEEEAPAPTPRDEEEFDFIDENPDDDAAVTKTEEKKKKKGLFGKKDKKEKPPKKDEPEEKPPVKDPDEKRIPEKLDEDGF